MWDAGRGGEPEAICRYCEGSRQRDAPRSPRPTRVAARTVGCCVALSTYGLRRAPCIRSVLATTHHAPIYEIGSNLESLVLSQESRIGRVTARLLPKQGT